MNLRTDTPTLPSRQTPHSDRHPFPHWPALTGAVVLVILILIAAVLMVQLPRQDRGLSVLPGWSSTDDGSISAEDGAIEDSDPIPYDSAVPAIERLQPEVRAALQAAGDAARSAGVDLRVTSGWRSEQLQQQLLADAIASMGEAEARKLVLDPAASAHVLGAAVDIGPTDAADWMGRFGADFGFCQTYANEMWHFELVAESGYCPPMRADAAS